MHEKNFIYRDMKPENFCVGLGKTAERIFVIDFGLCKKFRDPRTGTHIPIQKNKGLTGTTRYASINTHLGVEPSRRDDLESLGYMLMYFLRGDLPWQGIKGESRKDKWEKIKDKKVATPVEALCHEYPEQFATYLNYCRSLRFEERPDYIYLRKLFKELFWSTCDAWDLLYDWVVLNSKENQKALLTLSQVERNRAIERHEILNWGDFEGKESERRVPI